MVARWPFGRFGHDVIIEIDCRSWVEKDLNLVSSADIRISGLKLPVESPFVLGIIEHHSWLGFSKKLNCLGKRIALTLWRVVVREESDELLDRKSTRLNSSHA